MSSVHLKWGLVLVVFAALVAVPATYGQSTRGEVTGNVVDNAADSGLPGVTVELSSPHLQGTKTANTDAAGIAVSGSRFIPLTSAVTNEGDRTLRIGNATEPTALDVTLKFKYPKVLKRRLSISPLEPTVTGTNPDSAWHGDVIAVFGANFVDGPISVLFGDLPSSKVLFVSGMELRATA